MLLGRAYTEEDDRPGIAEPPVVLSYAFWKAELQGRPDVIGSEIALNRAPMRVIGVAAEGFLGTSVDLIGAWIPLHAVTLAQPENRFIGDASSCCVDILARLKPDVSRSQAQSEIAVLADQWPKPNRHESHGIRLSSASFFSHPRVQEKLGPILALLALAVALVLLLACANVSNLLLARAAARRKEIAVRLSLGAGRWRIIRQLLTESSMLSVASAAVGLGIATVLPAVLMRGFSFSTELAFRFDPDRRVLVFSILLSLMTTVMFGLMPALQATKLDLTNALKDSAAKLRRWDLRRGLAAAQVALCVVLLTGAGLLLRGLLLASQTDAGFDTRGLMVLHLDLRLFGYDQARAVALTQAMREKLLSVPGVEGVTYVDILPFGNNSNRTDFVPSHGRRTIEQAAIARVATQHLETLGIRLVAGRNFTPADIGRPVAIISETAARLGWGAEDPVGKKFNQGVEVIGVVRNSVYRSLESKLEATYFVPSAGGLDANFLVRLKDPRQVALLREAVRAIDPQVLPVINRLEEDIARSLQPSRMAAGIALGLGAFALTLACVGLYGVVAYNVTQRTKEIGIRIALGAKSSEVTGLVLTQNLRAVLGGLLVGLAGAAALSRLLVNILYGLSPLDPVAYGSVIVCLVMAVLTASLIPARRASRMDPMIALRTE